jgi:hypothetical protein
MDMLQIYILFSLKTIIHVQYFYNIGHVIKTCPFYPEIGFRNKDQSGQKIETWNKSIKLYYVYNQAIKKPFPSNW